ncbi:MAG: hypothetical protein Q7T79_03010 [bacterium]|nr:hypothetical protein [bacterium]
MKKIFITILISFLFFPIISFAKIESLGQKLSGNILLQVESHGEGWYVNPADQKRYSLGRPAEAWTIMRNLSSGITNANLLRIPVGIISSNSPDNDKDGLSNNIESALGTNPDDSDSDKDGYDDLTELKNNYDPLCPSNISLPIDIDFTKQHLGKIFLQIENKGEAWYINPKDKKRYFLGRPDDAFAVMKKLSLGITNKNLNKIPTKLIADVELKTKTTTTIIQQPITQPTNDPTIMEQAATAIRNNDQTTAKSFFTPNMEKIIEYTLNYFNQESRLMLANILSGANLTVSTDEQKIYSAKVYFSLGGYEVPVKFYVQKQSDGKWLIMNL